MRGHLRSRCDLRGGLSWEFSEGDALLPMDAATIGNIVKGHALVGNTLKR